MSFGSKSLSILLFGFLFSMVVGCGAEAETETVERKEAKEINVSRMTAASPGNAPELEPISIPLGAPQETDQSSSEGGGDANAEASTTAKADAADAKEATSDAAGFKVSVAEGGALTFDAPAGWKKADVKRGMFGPEFEIAVPKSEGEAKDAKDGRLTIMGAGGSIEANINRWYGQYSQPDGSDTKDASKVTESKVGDCETTFVDIKGTLMDKAGGPMSGGPVIERENYRMLAAIVQAGEHGQYFIKLYGPNKTISDNEAAFKSFVESLQVNDEAKGL